MVVSSSAYHDAQSDLIIMAVTSQMRPTNTIGEVLINNWKGAGLIKPSVVKPVLRRLERLAAQEQQSLRAAIGTIVG